MLLPHLSAPARCRLYFATWILWLASVPVHAAPEVSSPRAGKWAHEGAKPALTPDARVTWGKLDNGFRYALLPHQGVPGRVVVQLLVLSGSLDEKPDELGIAHYIEHLSFGGSKNFKSEDMVSLFQRLGVEYGSDVNAITTFDRTAFKLDFRENDPALLREGLRLFRDFGDGVSFSQATIEQERRVVLAELRLHETLADQRQNSSLPMVFRGLQFAHRTPGGSDQLIARFNRDQFLKFYRRCYRPDLMVLVSAGDFDLAAMTALTKEIFGDMVRPAEPIPARDEGKFDGRTQRAGVFRIAGVGSAQVSAMSVVPLATRPDSREARVESQRRQFVMELFEGRLRTQIREGSGAEAGFEELMGHAASSVTLGVSAPAWAKGLGEIDQMIRLTSERGFNAADVETLRKRHLRRASLHLDQLPNVDPGALCEDLTNSIAEHKVFVGTERELAWRKEWLEKVTPAEAQQTFRGLWPLTGMAYHVAGGVDIELTADKVLQAVQKSRKSGLSAVWDQQRRDTPFMLPKWGAPTNVAERSEIPELGAHLMRFGNNVRLNFVSSRQEPGIVRAVVRVGSGLLVMPGNKPALKEFALNTLLASGSVRFGPEQMSNLIEERLLEFGFDVEDRDAFTFRGAMGVEEIETFLGIVTDILHEPQFSNSAHQDERMRAAMGRIAGSMGIHEGLRELTDHLFKGDPRFTWGSELDYISMGVMDVRRWMQEPLSRGYVEVTIVGDMSEEAVVRSMSRTLGSLGPRAATKEMPETPKPVKVTAAAGFTRIEFVGEQNIGLVVGTWPVGNAQQVRDQAALQLLGKILELRVRTEVREKLGLAYSPSAEFQPYDGFPGFALLQAQIDCAPNDSGKIAPVIEAIGARLATEGVGEGEFIGARGILKSKLRGAFRQNGFLASILMRAQERPEELAEIRALHAGSLDSVTQEDVNKWAARILPASNCRTAAIVPKAFVGMFEGGK
ncbi:MAG TPA: insulinase family protein [Opitutaceae bacterium]|nr:insulinase family protein [Opitutaceae bacterium]